MSQRHSNVTTCSGLQYIAAYRGTSCSWRLAQRPRACDDFQLFSLCGGLFGVPFAENCLGYVFSGEVSWVYLFWKISGLHPLRRSFWGASFLENFLGFTSENLRGQLSVLYFFFGELSRVYLLWGTCSVYLYGELSGVYPLWRSLWGEPFV